ncbi:MAG: AI-2E family transporter [Chloroflexi bacterium]|nr:AI-2E family transporter [Chloroflexota bacterium]
MGPRIIRSSLWLMPMDQRESIKDLISAMETKVGAYIAGQGILMLVVGSMALVAYWLIGLPYVLVLAFSGRRDGEQSRSLDRCWGLCRRRWSLSPWGLTS